MLLYLWFMNMYLAIMLIGTVNCIKQYKIWIDKIYKKQQSPMITVSVA